MILVRYVLKELIGPFLASLFGITFLFVVDFLVKILDNVLSKGLPASTVIEIFVLNLAWMLSLSIPMAVLVASLMAFGRMSGDQEITAVKAAGVSPLSLMRPVLLVALLLSVLMVVFNNWVLPEANHRSVELMNAVSRKKPHVFIDAGRLITQFPGVQLWVNRIDPVSGTLYGIQILKWKRRALRESCMPIAPRWITSITERRSCSASAVARRTLSIRMTMTITSASASSRRIWRCRTWTTV